MRVTINKSNKLLTPALGAYVEKKFAPLAKFLKHFEDGGDVMIELEILRVENHHKKGEVFMAAANVRLPGKTIRAEARAEDVRKAIDETRDTLRREIEKFKEKSLTPKRGGGKNN